MKLKKYIQQKMKTHPGGYTYKQAAKELKITPQHLIYVFKNGAGKNLAVRINKWSNGEVSILEAMRID